VRPIVNKRYDEGNLAIIQIIPIAIGINQDKVIIKKSSLSYNPFINSLLVAHPFPITFAP